MQQTRMKLLSPPYATGANYNIYKPLDCPERAAVTIQWMVSLGTFPFGDLVEEEKLLKTRADAIHKNTLSTLVFDEEGIWDPFLLAQEERNKKCLPLVFFRRINVDTIISLNANDLPQIFALQALLPYPFFNPKELQVEASRGKGIQVGNRVVLQNDNSGKSVVK